MLRPSARLAERLVLRAQPCGGAALWCARTAPGTRAAAVLRTAIGVAAAATLLAAFPHAAPAADAVALRLDLPAGKTLHYKLDSQTEGTYQGIAFATRIAADMRVVSEPRLPSGNGAFTVTFVKVEASAQQGNELLPQELGVDGKKAIAEVTPQGKVVRVEPPAELESPQRQLVENLVQAVFFELPGQPVKPGETWKLDVGRADGSGSGTGTFTFEEMTKKGTTPVAKILGELQVSRTNPTSTGKGTNVAQIAVPGGWPVHAKGALDLKGEGPAMRQTYELQLVP